MRFGNITSLGIKELRGLARDPIMLGLVVFSFVVVVYATVKALPAILHEAPIAIADQDQSPLSQPISDQQER